MRSDLLFKRIVIISIICILLSVAAWAGYSYSQRTVGKVIAIYDGKNDEEFVGYGIDVGGEEQRIGSFTHVAPDIRCVSLPSDIKKGDTLEFRLPISVNSQQVTLYNLCTSDKVSLYFVLKR